MKIKITKEDIKRSELFLDNRNPVEIALEEALNTKVSLDRRFMIVTLNDTEVRLFRSPESVQNFTYRHYTRQKLEPFAFELNV